MKLNPIGIIGGIILIVSPFLAWISVFFINISLLDMALSGDMVSILILILLIVGGIIALFKGLIGGIIGLVGVLIFTAFSLAQGAPISVFGLGYYLGWVGSIISIASIFFKPRVTPTSPPSPPPPPP
ncbi:MAG: hypothetical protein HXX80_05910 [Nitrososphaerales archaeon]|nr:hypothetical protein [Nitrososphaerales archaeon]